MPRLVESGDSGGQFRAPLLPRCQSPGVSIPTNFASTANGVLHDLCVSPAAVALLADLDRAKREGCPQKNLLTELSGTQSVHCSEKLFVPHLDKNKSITWNFTVTCRARGGQLSQLVQVFMLDPCLPEFSITEVKVGQRVLQCSPQGCDCAGPLPPSAHTKVSVRFSSKNYGSFNQRLIFNFGDWPKLVRHLGVVVAPEQDLVQHLKLPAVHEQDSELVWLGKHQLVPLHPVQEQQVQAEFALPPNMAHHIEYGAFDHLEDSLAPQLYRSRLHMLLHVEESERRKQMTRLTLHCDDVKPHLEASREEPDQQTLVLPILRELVEEASVLVSRGSKALVRILPPGSRERVLYEVMVESLRVDSVVLRVNSELKTAIKRAAGGLEADVCFRFVDTYRYMHRAIKRIDLKLVFPNQWRRESPTMTRNQPEHEALNRDQADALHRIVASPGSPPLLLLGPFGTGKTQTIAEAVKELCRRQARDPTLNLRMLVCTHSNSAADHYINDYLHEFVQREMAADTDCRPLRVCWEHRFTSTLSDTVLQYCLINQKNGKFLTPRRRDVEGHRVVVTTLVTADVLVQLGLPLGYFTHIFIDEAAQAMEVEAIIPLGLADAKTTVVMAGDHLQLNPPILSKTAKRLGLGRSLLVRLNQLFPQGSGGKLMLLQNYRSYEDIVQIPSAIFYDSRVIANLEKPADLGYSVHFYGVLGREEQAKEQPTFFNRAEAAEVADRVEELCDSWPSKYWGRADPSKICVLAPYPAQVREIRRLLRQKHLNAVRVEGVTNVQGLEFDALFISTVRTYNTMSTATLDESNLGFLSNPQLLNTAVTRARYYLAVVGDPNALCSVGENKVCWRLLLKKCNEHGTFRYRLPFETLMKMIGTSSHNNASLVAGVTNPVQPVVPAQPPVEAPRFVRSPPAPVVFGPVVAAQQRSLSPVLGRPPLLAASPYQPHVFTGPRFSAHHQPTCFPYVPPHVRPGITCPPNAAQSYRALVRNVAPVPGHPAQILSEKNRSRGDQFQAPGFVRAPGPKQVPGPHSSGPPAVSSSETREALPPFATADNHAQEPREARPAPSKTSSQLRDGTRKDVVKLVSAVDGNLRLRRRTLENDSKSLDSVLSRGVQDDLLREQLAMLRTLLQDELETLSRQARIQDQVNNMLGLEPGTEDTASETIATDDGNFPDENVQAELNLDAIQADEDAIDLDTSEWFEARRRDPIVQEYIQAYERIMNQKIMDERAKKNHSKGEVEDRPEDDNTFSAATEKSSADENVFSQDSQPVAHPAIYEEYLGEEQMKEEISSGELLKCTLFIDSARHGNSALAKVADPSKPDVAIPTRIAINRALHGDVVAVRVTGYQFADPNIPIGKVVGICQEVHHREVVCRCDLVEKNIMVPINKHNPRFVVVRNDDEIAIHGIQDGRFYCKTTVTETKGKLFVLRFMQWGATYRFPLGFVLRYFSETQDPRQCLPILAAEFGIHRRHSKQSQAELRSAFPVSWKIPDSELSARPPCYNNAFTIDPEGSTELDDALSVVEEDDGTYTVGVHITDVSYFIPKDSALDKAAYAHAQSLYPGEQCGHHIPMLPAHVTRNLCSLDRGKPRLAVSTVFRLDADGKQLREPAFHRSVVQSKCQLTYRKCQEILQGGAPSDVSKSVQRSVRVLGSLASKMASRRLRGGCAPEGEWCENHQAFKAVEEFMLLTNLSVAARLLSCPQAKGAVPLRRQLPPKSHLLRSLLEKCAAWGLWPPHHLSLRCLCASMEEDQKPCADHMEVDVSTWEKISAALDRRDLQKLTDLLTRPSRGGLVADALSTLAFSQEKGDYVVSSDAEPSRRRHFSLNAPAYTHFTSPLRRYLDLVVHRVLIAALSGKSAPYSREELAEICAHCNTLSARGDAFEKQLGAVCAASLAKKESTWKAAKFDSISADQVSFTGRGLEGVAYRSVQLRELKPSSREWNREEGELVLSWNSVELDFSTGAAVSGDGPLRSLDSNPSEAMSRQFLKIPSATWLSFLDSVCAESFERMGACRQALSAAAVVALEDRALSTGCELSVGAAGSKEGQPHVRVDTQFCRRRDPAAVLLTGRLHQGFPQPTVLAVRLAASVVCCILHHRRPTDVFCEPLERATRKTYSDVHQYQAVMAPLLTAESAASSVNCDVPYKLELSSVPVKWTCDTADRVWRGQFTARRDLCVTHGVTFRPGDFLCVRVSRAAESTEDECRILHCRVTDVQGANAPTAPVCVTFIHCVTEKGCDPPESLLRAGNTCMEVITQSLPYRRMITAVNRLGDASELARSVVLRRDVPAYTARNPHVPDPSAVQLVDGLELNEGQLEAVRKAVTSPLSLIQGPPGTGKTWTAMAIIRQFVSRGAVAGSGAGQVLFCAPSNQAVDVAARMLQKVEGLRALRVYGRQIESQMVKPASPVRVLSRPEVSVDVGCEEIALHLRVRRPQNPHSKQVQALEEQIERLRGQERAANGPQKEKYREELVRKLNEHHDALDKAEKREMAHAHVILCTCTEAGSSRVRRHVDAAHVIIDESSTCLEAEVLVVLSSVGPRCRNVVLLGDHKQLAPVVRNKAARKLGLARSLFEVMFEGRAHRAYVTHVLETQYRMHPSIRQFPSQHFYQGQLRDAAQVTSPARLARGLVKGLWPGGSDVRLVFCHVVGQEESPQDCTGAEGREESKYNEEEVDKTVEVVEFLQSRGVPAKHISVYTPYTAQRTRLSKKLQSSAAGPVEVLSVSSSQGSEQDFVIISTVRSVPPERVQAEAGLQWQLGRLGFLTDEHQMNVAITRAKHGLIIIGNRHLLAVHEMWRSLLSHYDELGCVVDKSDWP